MTAPGASARTVTAPPTGPDVSQIMRGAVHAGTPAALLAIIPYLTGFEPGASLIVVGLLHDEVKVALRYELEDASPEEATLHAIRVLASQHLTAVSAVGYGPATQICVPATALRRHAARVRIEVRMILRAENGRYWSCRCTEPGWCSHKGRPYDARRHPCAAALAAAGVRVLPSRAALAATVAPVEGPVRESMRRATRLAERSLRTTARLRRHPGARTRRAAVTGSGFTAVSKLISRYRSGRRTASLYHCAWLALLLTQRRVRDDAWARMDPRYKDAHLRLWTDVVRRAEPGYVAAPASLLAFVAWQAGNGALANVALDRALADDPSYPMAELLRRTITGGAPPSSARIPLPPEEESAAFGENE